MSILNAGKVAIALFMGWPARLRNPIYRFMGIDLGDCEIRYNVFITNPSLLRVEKGCFINSNVSFFFGAGSEAIELGKNGLFGGFCGRDSGIGPAQRAKTTIWN